MSQFVATVVPGYTWQDGELWTAEKANLAGTPTVNFNYSSTGSLTLGAGSVGIANLTAGMFTADVTGRAPFVDGWLDLALIGNGIFTADAYGRAPFASGWLTANMVAAGTFTADTNGRPQFASGWLKATLVQPDAYWYAVGAGSGTAVTAAFTPALNIYTNPTLSTYWDGLVVAIKMPAAAGAAATLNVGLGAATVYRMDGTALVGGEWAINQVVELRYNSSLASGAGGWQMTSPPPFASYYRAGSGTATGATATTITFSTAVPSTAYSVAIAPTESLTVSPSVSNKTTAGFTITFTGATGTHTFDYIILPTL